MTEIRFKDGLMQVKKPGFGYWKNVVDTKLLAELSGVLQTATPGPKKQAQTATPKAEQAQTSTTGATPSARYQTRLDERMTLFGFSVINEKTLYEKLVDDLFPRSISNPRDGGKSYYDAYIAGRRTGYREGLADGMALLVENKVLSAQARELTKKVDFWQAVAARRKERCNYLAEEMRKYRDMPVEQRISGVRNKLTTAGVTTVHELVKQRDTERDARLAGVATMDALRAELARVRRELERTGAGAELAELRAINDKLQASVDSVVVENTKLRQQLRTKTTELGAERVTVAQQAERITVLAERAEAAEADARIKGENWATAKELLSRCVNFISHIVPARRDPGHIYDVVAGFLAGKLKD